MAKWSARRKSLSFWRRDEGIYDLRFVIYDLGRARRAAQPSLRGLETPPRTLIAPCALEPREAPSPGLRPPSPPVGGEGRGAGVHGAAGGMGGPFLLQRRT